MFVAKITNSIDSAWSCLEPVRVGRVPKTLRTPERFVTITQHGEPAMRVDVYSYGPYSFSSEEAIVWRDTLVIVGFGSHVHAINIINSTVVTVELGSYFGHIYPSDNFVLLASAEHLFRLEPDRTVLWKSDDLAIDGVIVEEIGPNVIRGDGEWDPPGGWRPFAVSVVDGKLT